jgi:hypothetical protein
VFGHETINTYERINVKTPFCEPADPAGFFYRAVAVAGPANHDLGCVKTVFGTMGSASGGLERLGMKQFIAEADRAQTESLNDYIDEADPVRLD